MRSRPLEFAAGLALALAGCSNDLPGPAAVGGVAAASGADPGVAGEPLGEPIDPLEVARDDYRAGRYDAVLARIEPILRARPQDRGALFLLVATTQAQGDRLTGKDRKGSIPLFRRSAEAARQFRKAHKDFSPVEAEAIAQALYNDACSLAIGGQPDAAMAALAECFDAGFAKPDIFEKDPELDSLRKRPDIQELVARQGPGKPDVAAMLKDNKPFPFALDLPDLEGRRIALADLTGKIVIVDFWGTWCPPCREELPVLAALHEKYRGRGLEVIGINCQEGPGPDTRGKVKAFLEKNKVPYRCALSDEKVEAQVPDLEAFPTTLFLDRSGTVRLKLVGFDPKEKDLLEQVVKALLDET